MKRPGTILCTLALLVLVGWLFISLRSISPETAHQLRLAEISATNATAAPVALNNSPSPSTNIAAPPLLGETILRDYANPSTPPENDLTLLAHLMDNFSVLVKSAADLPLSANEDWAAALRGFNPAHERFLPDTHLALDAKGRLVDRWRTPLFFHALGNHRFDLRSAGPDKKLWTADDLHRNAEGSFRRGADLNPASLLDSAPRH